MMHGTMNVKNHNNVTTRQQLQVSALSGPSGSVQLHKTTV